jgi:hypothetical protein
VSRDGDQVAQKLTGGLQVMRVESLGEPVVDGTQELAPPRVGQSIAKDA